MKNHILYITQILFFVTSIFCNSQDARLFQNDWHLTKLTIDGTDTLNPKDTGGLPVILFFDGEGSSEYSFSTGVCDVIIAGINFDVINPEFTITSVSQTLGGCGTFWDPSNILSNYHNFYSNGSLLSYEIIENLGVLQLTLTAANGDKAIYSEPKQIERIDVGSWALTNMYVNNESHRAPLNSRGTPVSTEFGSDVMGNYTFGSWVCESSGGKIDYTFENNTLFTVSNVYSTLGGCDFASGVNSNDVYDIDSKLFNFFNQEGNYMYVIIDENDGTKKLIIASPNNFDYAYYTRLTLSNKVSSKISFSISPNPVVDELTISSSEDIKNHKIEIFDLLGKLKISKTRLDSNSIDVSSLSNGVYVILIKDDFGNMSTKKFVKI